MSKKIIIAIDGPAGAGKSTIAKEVAKKLSLEYIDTGAMYRALTLKVLDLGIDPKSPGDVIAIMKDTEVDFKDNHIYLDGKNVDKEIRENRINNSVSYIAAIKEIRQEMVRLQQNMSQRKSLIMDGRDIGSVVLPNANFKIFITASVDERANRRHLELLAKGSTNISFDQIKKEIINRDQIDTTRENSPLIQSPDAYLLDNTNMTIEESVERIISIVKEKI